MHARRAEYVRSEEERFRAEREARRARFDAPLFDFTTPHTDTIAREKLLREEKVRERTERLRSFLASSQVRVIDVSATASGEPGEVSALNSVTIVKPPKAAPDGSVDLYEAMYASKGAQITPEDYSDHSNLNIAAGRNALANINSVILSSRHRRAQDLRDEPAEASWNVPQIHESRGGSAGTLAQKAAPAKGERRAVHAFPLTGVPWFRLMFKRGGCRQAESWRRRKMRGDGSDADIMRTYQALTWTQRLHEEMLAFVAWADLTSRETAARTQTLANVSIISQTLWPDCQLAPFGSFYNGLSLPGADIDICIQNVPCGENTRNEIHELARLLRVCPFASDITTVTKARVPIVKFCSDLDNVQVDLTINQESAMETSAYIHQRMRQWRPLRPLILVVKLLLRNNDLNETYRGGVGSYMLLNMLIHHLQMEARQHQTGRASPADCIDTMDLGELLLSFLMRYANFDYVFDAIDIRGDGRLFPKADMSEELCNRLYVVSPLEPRLDVGKSSYNMDEVVDLFNQTHQKLRASMSNKDDTASLLAQVIDPESALFKHRKVDLTNHPIRADFSVYESPAFPEIPDSLIRDSHATLEDHIAQYRLNMRARYQRRHDGPYERGGNHYDRRRQENRGYDRHR